MALPVSHLDTLHSILERRPLYTPTLSQLGIDFLNRPVTAPITPHDDGIKRERGAANIALDDHGRAAMERKARLFAEQIRAAKQAGHPISVCLYSSRWDRTLESARIFQDVLSFANPELEIVDALAPQSLGEWEGEPSVVVKPKLDKLRKTQPNVAPPGKSPLTGHEGEPYTSYINRVVPAIRKMLNDLIEDPTQVSIVLDHSSGMGLVRGWVDRGAKRDNSIDIIHIGDKISSDRTDRITRDKNSRWKYQWTVQVGGRKAIIPGLYLQRHGDTSYQ